MMTQHGEEIEYKIAGENKINTDVLQNTTTNFGVKMDHLSRITAMK
jgi:hypothetical protein